jgi:hypothetical protein
MIAQLCPNKVTTTVSKRTAAWRVQTWNDGCPIGSIRDMGRSSLPYEYQSEQLELWW